MKKITLIIIFILFIPVSVFAQHEIIRSGLNWLVDQQAYLAGYWEQEEEVRIRDTTEVLETLRLYSWTGEPWTIGISWLDNEPVTSNDFLARKIYLLKLAGEDPASLEAELIAAQNSDYGWGDRVNHGSNIIDTVYALKALGDDTPNLSSVTSFLRNNRELVKGWDYSIGLQRESKIYPTAISLCELSKYLPNTDSAIVQGRAWLLTKQNGDGGFGDNGISVVYETAFAILALMQTGSDNTDSVITQAMGYIKVNQLEEGCWGYSIFSTAVALRALDYAPLDCIALSGDPVGNTLLVDKIGRDIELTWSSVPAAYGYYVYNWSEKTKEYKRPPLEELYGPETSYIDYYALEDAENLYYKVEAIECINTPTPTPTATLTSTPTPTETPTLPPKEQ